MVKANENAKEMLGGCIETLMIEYGKSGFRKHMVIPFELVDIRCRSICMSPCKGRNSLILSHAAEISFVNNHIVYKKGILIVAFLTDTKRFTQIASTFGGS